MALFIQSSIRRQLILVVLCTSLLGLGIVYATFELYERASFRRSLTEELSTLAHTVGANGAATLSHDDRKSAEQVLANLAPEHHIMAAFLYDIYGHSFAAYRRPGVSPNFSIPFSQEDGKQFTADTVNLQQSLFQEGHKVGAITIVSDLSDLQVKMRGYNEISALALILSVFATLFISSRLLRLITEPILQLAEVAGKVSSEQNYALRAIPQSNDEVGRLVHSFNGMLQRIQERDTELKDINDELELRVEARTQELQLEVEQRKETEGRLQASLKELEDFKFALDQHCNVSRTDPEGIITFVNEKFCAVSKYSSEEMIGKTHRTVNSGHHRKDFFDDLWRTIKSGRSWKGEVQNKAKDGSLYWSDTTVVPFSDGHGKQIQYIAIRSDVTRLKQIEEKLRLEVGERIRAEEALSAERTILRALIDHMPDFMYVKDAQSRFLVANAALAHSMGLKGPEELLGKTDFDFFPRELADGYFQDEQNVIRAKQALFNREEECVDARGNKIWLLTTKVPLYDRNGEVAGIAGVGRNITEGRRIENERQRANEALEARTKELQSEVEERVRAQETLSAERQILHALIDNVPDYMYVKDTDCRFLLANVAVARQMGAKGPEELLGKTDFDFYPRDLASTFFEDEQRVIRMGQAEINREESGMDPQGNLSHVLTTQVPLKDKNGHVIGLAGIGHDITHLKKIQEEMQKAREAAEAGSRAKSEFLANMSHEIRTPLNGIMGMTDLALETELDREQREYLETVKVSADSLLTVINDILDFSKIEAGKIDLEFVDFDVRDSLESALKTLAVRGDEKGLELLCEVAPDVPEVARGDITRLRQVLLNLIGNAIKFTDEGEVAVKVRQGARDGRELVLHFTVSDTGIGIPKDKQEMIFDPFSQADSSTTRKYGGTGLGLTISARLVRMMGGQIWVESEAGRGSQFHFTVRLQTADPKEIRVGSPAPVEILRGARVLVVDDNRTNLRILESMLKRWEMVPVCVEGGEQALVALASAQKEGRAFRLIVTDMHMPKMNGFELVEHIREKPELCTATIMMLTSAGHRGDAELCRKLGVSAYLLKPIRQSELREAIAKVLGAREQEGMIPLVTRFSLGDARDRTETLRILIAEDNLVNQRLVVRLLEKRGHRVVVAASGKETLAALEKAAVEKDAFDIILMDVQMPEMDGFEATAAIRTKEKISGLHQIVVALTAHAMKGDQERCLAAGMDGYLSKPIRPQELDEVLARYGASNHVNA